MAYRYTILDTQCLISLEEVKDDGTVRRSWELPFGIDVADLDQSAKYVDEFVQRFIGTVRGVDLEDEQIEPGDRPERPAPLEIFDRLTDPVDVPAKLEDVLPPIEEAPPRPDDPGPRLPPGQEPPHGESPRGR